jgi:hypothetical protein
MGVNSRPFKTTSNKPKPPWRFEPTMVVVLFGVLRFVLAMVGVVARVMINVKIDIKNDGSK